MTVQLGCVLAIRDRPAEMLERTLATYAYQTLMPWDKVLLHYGSAPPFAESYRDLCERYGWRLIVHDPRSPRWSSSDAFNRAVSQLAPEVDVVFKNDAEMLLGENVLEIAANQGRDKLCIFPCLQTHEGTHYPRPFTRPGDLTALFDGAVPPTEMPSEGVQAYPHQWFTELGGLDLAYHGWEFDDSDLRERAKWSIGVTYVSGALVIHQWHPPSTRPSGGTRNRAHYERIKRLRQVVRNGGRLCVPGTTLRVAVVTRSLSEEVSRLSEEFLDLDGLAERFPRAGSGTA